MREYWNALCTVCIENWTNRKRTFRLASYELIAQNNGTWFGYFWNFLNPALQILVYWFVFAIGLQVKAPQNGCPYLIWMIVGIIPWFFISAALQTSAMSIYAYSGVLKRVHLPLSIVPIKTVLAGLMSHLIAMLVVLVIVVSYGIPISNRIYELPYYMVGVFLFLCGWGLLTSSITVVFKDFQKLLGPFIRLLFYITPIVWNQDALPDELKRILRLNPLGYIIQGYRNCILDGIPFWSNMAGMIEFWCVSIFLILFGIAVHMKFRKRFLDLI